MGNSENIIYTTKAQEKIDKILTWGPGKVQVIADFDKTLTYGNQESIIAVLYNYQYLSEDYTQKAKELEKIYQPKEEDQTLSWEERQVLMNERRVKHFQILIESGLTKKHIEKVVDSGIVKLRNWCHEFIDQLHTLGIPMIILSASGLGMDSIERFFHEHLGKHQKLFIISNGFVRNEEGRAIMWKEPIITSLNKNETVISEKHFPEIYHEIQGRTNIILLGDKIEDLSMAEGVPSETILKIWFLNSWNEEKLRLYEQYFDIIIPGELGMEEVMKILGKMR